jgi:hypothetical protein
MFMLKVSYKRVAQSSMILSRQSSHTHPVLSPTLTVVICSEQEGIPTSRQLGLKPSKVEAPAASRNTTRLWKWLMKWPKIIKLLRISQKMILSKARKARWWNLSLSACLRALSRRKVDMEHHVKLIKLWLQLEGRGVHPLKDAMDSLLLPRKAFITQLLQGIRASVLEIRHQLLTQSTILELENPSRLRNHSLNSTLVFLKCLKASAALAEKTQSSL